MWMQELPFEAGTHDERRARALFADLLRAGSRMLDGLAARLTIAARSGPGDTTLEFHADAGAPEGALYVNGRLVGHVLGVNRL